MRKVAGEAPVVAIRKDTESRRRKRRWEGLATSRRPCCCGIAIARRSSQKRLVAVGGTAGTIVLPEGTSADRGREIGLAGIG
ncbi:hypothetical protein ACBY01_12215 [Sphingomonas sp. ac-8]|uniref:hypothetical protein n=1 Tax=Sphingomonas sp. ac-8 TaxID=3242977 RepID=UPI003A806372